MGLQFGNAKSVTGTTHRGINNEMPKMWVLLYDWAYGFLSHGPWMGVWLPCLQAIGGGIMGKVTRSYALDPGVAAWMDKQPDGRGKTRSRSMMVSEAIFYYWMHEADTIATQIRNLKEVNKLYLEELRILRAKKGLLHRLKRLLRMQE